MDPDVSFPGVVRAINRGGVDNFWLRVFSLGQRAQECDPSMAESVCRFSSEFVESSRCRPADLMVLGVTDDVNLGRIG